MTALAPERLAILRRVATIESIGSSTRIEGAKLSDREVEALLGRLNQTPFVSRDEQEVAGYAEVMDAIFESHTAIPLTENHISNSFTPCCGGASARMSATGANTRSTESAGAARPRQRRVVWLAASARRARVSAGKVAMTKNAALFP